MIEAKPKIFISYSIADADARWISDFIQALRSQGIEATFAESTANYRLRDSLLDSLELGLRSSDIVVIVLPKGSQVNPTILFELGAAVGMGKRILVVASAETKIREVPLALRAEKVLLQESASETAAAVAAAARVA